MRSIGVKKLKNDLSRYLKLVKQGEVVYVTDRDEIVAEIHKPTTPSSIIDPWTSFLNQLERQGSLRRAKLSESQILSEWKSEISKNSPVSSLEILQELRRDRF